MISISREHILKWIKKVNRYGANVKIGTTVLSKEESYDLLMLALAGLSNDSQTQGD